MFEVTLNGLTHVEGNITVNVSGTVTQTDVGKAVSQDATAPNTVKLAGDGDVVIGKLIVLENRTVEGQVLGTVATRGGMKFPKASATVIAVGDSIIGAGNGLVKKDTTTSSTRLVWEVGSEDVTVWLK